MNIKEAKQEIVNTLRAYHRKDETGQYCFPLLRQRPILLMGPPGIGKTAIMAQIAAEENVGLVAYTMTHHTRQSAIGLPHIETRSYQGGPTISVTEYTLSEIIASIYDCIERTGKREGILFLDEVNCVSETLAPTMLQLLQNKTFGSHRVPDGWMIVAAGNPPAYNKSVREFDVVTLDRLRKIDIEPDCGVWMEYARQQQVHGAVLSYLSIREDRFYSVRREADEISFVTARGWEDLSELLKSYEALDIPISEPLVAQYLQDTDAARSFAGYYQLYRKYSTDYGIRELLDGTLTDWSEKAAMAKSGSFDERFTVVNLLLDCLNNQFAAYDWADSVVCRLHRTLQALKSFLHANSGNDGIAAFLDERRSALKVKRQAELLSYREEREEQWVLNKLEDYRLSLEKEHITGSGDRFARMAELFQQETAERKKLVGQIQMQLERAFRFLEACFGDGQEIILFVSTLTRTERAMAFISLHGCQPYLHYSQKLLYKEQERSLRDACLAVLAQQ